MIISLISYRLNQNTCIQVGIWLIQGLVSVKSVIVITLLSQNIVNTERCHILQLYWHYNLKMKYIKSNFEFNGVLNKFQQHLDSKI